MACIAYSAGALGAGRRAARVRLDPLSPQKREPACMTRPNSSASTVAYVEDKLVASICSRAGFRSEACSCEGQFYFSNASAVL